MMKIKGYNEFIGESVKEKGFFRTREQIETWLDKYYISRYIINDDLSVDVENWINLQYKKIKYLPIKFDEVTGGFDIRDNNLTSLKGCPKFVGSDFDFRNNQITNLEYSPKIVKGNFWCNNNPITSLKNHPEKIGGKLWCKCEVLTTLCGLDVKFDLSKLELIVDKNLLKWNWLVDILTEDILLFEFHKKWIKNNLDWATSEFKENFGHLLEIDQYNV